MTDGPSPRPDDDSPGRPAERTEAPERAGHSATTEHPEAPERAEAPAGEDEDAFSLLRVFGGWNGLLDAGLPGLAFVATFTITGQQLRPALMVAIGVGVVFAAVRLVRRDPLQNVVGGFFGVAIAALIANATGKAADFYLPGLFINAAYAIGYLVANLVRWPLIGVVVGLAAGWGTAWRDDPVLLRAFTRAGWLWSGFFLLKLAVQLPLYLADQVVALGVARVVMGWPLWLVLLWLTYVVVKGSVPQEHFRAVKQAAERIAARQHPNK
ncbi:Protein of unknown function [Actinopolymorpha cephalotaxi]|uniref:DUF3159 domain-containing protein n=1 Tax=Actinopolymorpha cephalotaxi TaxID=504797 RepID=A0A1I2PM43_9ACTN|nr:DUF3159 domain-containing protein [Actinopolymorpha cephalotaxi]NYH83568.1 hypothetical protein [Actinopolymorpha cephalotaxi]SFG16660.1 Protein of unknown function [Actinopolymorpha cephalotaxi]